MIEHSKIKGHEKYKTVIRHHKNGVYFLMDDALITKVEKKIVHESQAYILIYGLKSTKQNKMIKHNISSQRKLLKEKQVQLDDKDLETVPYFWYEKLMTLKNPGRINSEFYCCPHNLIKPDFYDCFPLLEFNNCKYFSEFFRNLFIFQSSDDNINELYETQMNKIFCQTRINVQRMSFESITLPKAIVEYIYDHYGGKNLIADMKICQKCLVYTQNLRQRKLLERSLINKYESIQSSVFAVVEKEWYNIWREFLYSEQRFSTRHFIKGYPLPGAINNSNLLINSEEDIPLHDLHLGKHYVIVSGYVWMILKSVYDGGYFFINLFFKKNNYYFGFKIVFRTCYSQRGRNNILKNNRGFTGFKLLIRVFKEMKLLNY